MIRKAVAMAVMVGFVAMVWTGEAMAACRSCATKLVLSRAEWSCLKPRLAEYLEDSVEPVIASVLNCEASVARTDGTVKATIPDIRPATSADAPDVDAGRKVFYLTRAQVQCLQGRIDLLISAGRETPVATDLAPCLP